MKSVDEFIISRKNRGVCENTRQWYREILTKWAEVREGEFPSALSGFLEGKKPATQRSHFAAVRAFEHWLEEEGESAWIGKVHMKFHPTPEPAVLTPDEFERLLGRLRDTWQDQCYRALFSTLWYTGARLGAIRLLKPGDVDLEGRRIHILTKGGVERNIALPDPCVLILKAWMQETVGVWLFPSARDPRKAVAKSSIEHRLAKIAVEAGISRRVWVHLIRHSAITHWLSQGMPIEVAKVQAGHSSITTTLRYTHLAGETVRKALDAVYREVG